MDWQNNLVDGAAIPDLLRDVKRVAVLGIKTEKQSSAPAYYVAHYLQQAGLQVVPVPVYFPDVTEIMGERVYRKLADIPGEIDLVDVFRRPEDLEAHVPDILLKKPRAVWMQLGIRHAGVAETLARAGIQVVQDHCLMVEHRKLR